MNIKKGKKLLHNEFELNNQCNHTLDNNSTLIMMPKRNMIFPPTQDYYCACCKKIFKTVQDGEGHISLVASL